MTMTKHKPPSPICPSCDQPLPQGSPEGLCPACLLERALDSGEGDPGPPPDGPELGTRLRYLGDYELLEEIGRGGMGVVYKARQRSLERCVAVKVLPGGIWADEVTLRRFRVEAQAAARLSHPQIVAIHEVGEHEGQPFFSMDLVEGESLEEVVRRGPIRPQRAAAIVMLLARAVEAAHGEGVLHRDLKPSNILLDENGEPHISDFGLAKILDAEVGPSTLTGAALGTPGYMPPEQVRSRTGAGDEAAGPAGDVYSLGAILYALLAGRAPFAEENPVATMLEVLRSEPTPLRRLRSDVPRDLETIAAKCLAKDPARRYTSADELADDLDRYLAGTSIHARRAGLGERAVRFARRHPWPAGLAAALLLILALRPWNPILEAARFDSLLTDARVHRLAGEREAAFAAIRKASTTRWAKPQALQGIGEDAEKAEALRFEAVRVSTTPGVRRLRQFYQAFDIDVSEDGRYLAAVQAWTRRMGGSTLAKDTELTAEIWNLETGDSLAQHAFNGRGTLSDAPMVRFIPSRQPAALLPTRSTLLGLDLWDPILGLTQKVCRKWDPRYLMLSPDGSWALNTRQGISICPLEDTDEPASKRKLPIRADVLGSYDGRHLLLRGFLDTLRECSKKDLRADPKRPCSVSWTKADEDEAILTLAIFDLDLDRISAIPVAQPLFDVSHDFRIALYLDSEDQESLLVWNLAEDRLLGRLPEIPLRLGKRRVPEWTVSPDNRRLALRAEENPREIHIWDLTDLQREPHVLRLPANRRLDVFHPKLRSFHDKVVFSPSGRLLAISGMPAYPRPRNRVAHGWTIWIWDVDRRHEIAEIIDQNEFFWSSENQIVTQGQCEAPEDVEKAFADYTEHIDALADIPNYPPAAWFGATLWEIRRSREIPVLPPAPRRLSFHPDGTLLAVDRQLWTVNTESSITFELSLERTEIPSDAFIHIDSAGRLWEVDPERDLNFERMREGQGEKIITPPRLHRLDKEGKPVLLDEIKDVPFKYRDFADVAFSPDGSSVLVGYTSNDEQSDLWLARWDLTTGERLPIWPKSRREAKHNFHRVDRGGTFQRDLRMKFTPDGNYVVTRRSLLDARSGENIIPPERRTDIILDFNSSSGYLSKRRVRNRIVSYTIESFEIKRGENLEAGRGPGPLSPDGQLIISREHSKIRILSTTDSREILRIPSPPENPVDAYSFHPSSRFLITVNRAGELKAWDLEAIPADLAAMGLEW